MATTPKTRDEILAAYLVTRGVTKCAPAKARGRSLRRMVREHEARLAREFEAREDDTPEHEAERRAEHVGRYRAEGLTASEALADWR